MNYTIRNSLLIAILGMTLACGSTQTIDSNQVPYKRPASSPDFSGTEDTRADKVQVQDIHQRYSLSYRDKDQSTSAIAQFRVHNQWGDSIRFSDPSQTRFEQQSMDFRDGDVINAVTGILNHLTIIPIFSLLRTGSFYSANANNQLEGEFIFIDDDAHKSIVQVKVPSLVWDVRPESMQRNPASNITINLKGEISREGRNDLDCRIKSEWLDEDNHTKTEISSGDGNWQTNSGTCVFNAFDLKKHEKAKEATIELTRSTRSQKSDPWGREILKNSSYIIEHSVKLLD